MRTERATGRLSQGVRRRWFAGAIAVTAMLVGLTAGAAGGVSVPALPVLWTAGGIDPGATGAGQAGRLTSDAAGNVAVVSGPTGGRDLAVTSYAPERSTPMASHDQPGLGHVPGGLDRGSARTEISLPSVTASAPGAIRSRISVVRYASDGDASLAGRPRRHPSLRSRVYSSMPEATPTSRSARSVTAATSRCTSTAPPGALVVVAGDLDRVLRQRHRHVAWPSSPDEIRCRRDRRLSPAEPTGSRHAYDAATGARRLAGDGARGHRRPRRRRRRTRACT